MIQFHRVFKEASLLILLPWSSVSLQNHLKNLSTRECNTENCIENTLAEQELGKLI